MIDWSIPKNREWAKKIRKYDENHPRPSTAEVMKQLDEFRDELYKCEREDKI